MYVCIYALSKKRINSINFLEPVQKLYTDVRLSKIHKKFTKMAPYFGIK